jgi:fructose/tagatose bisphosphate aldolase
LKTPPPSICQRPRPRRSATFGNVHGVYKLGGVKLRPEILKDIQAHVRAKIGKDNPFDLVFHCDSGSSDQEIADAVSYGVIKMNIDTQHAYTRPVADYMFKNYDVMKVDGEVGNKKTYDPATGAPPPKPDWPAGSSKLPSNSVQPERPSRTHTAH